MIFSGNNSLHITFSLQPEHLSRKAKGFMIICRIRDEELAFKEVHTPKEKKKRKKEKIKSSIVISPGDYK